MTTTTVFGCNLQVGDRFDLGSTKLLEVDIIDFARAWDPQDFHTDVDHAADGPFGGIIASGIHSLAIFQSHAVRAQFAAWSIIAGRGIRDTRFLRPARPNDILAGSMTIGGIRSASATADVVDVAGVLANQHGENVLTLTLEIQIRHAPGLVRTVPSAAAPD